MGTRVRWKKVKWSPAYANPPVDDAGNSAEVGTPLLETVPMARLITVVNLHDGVLGHASARRLGQLKTLGVVFEGQPTDAAWNDSVSIWSCN